jgi:hypothetical protein
VTRRAPRGESRVCLCVLSRPRTVGPPPTTARADPHRCGVMSPQAVLAHRRASSSGVAVGQHEPAIARAQFLRRCPAHPRRRTDGLPGAPRARPVLRDRGWPESEDEGTSAPLQRVQGGVTKAHNGRHVDAGRPMPCRGWRETGTMAGAMASAGATSSAGRRPTLCLVLAHARGRAGRDRPPEGVSRPADPLSQPPARRGSSSEPKVPPRHGSPPEDHRITRPR